MIDEQLASFGAQLRVEATVDSVEVIRRLVLAGIGTTIMPVSAFHAEIAAGSVVACTIEGANLHRILVLARPLAPTRSAAIDEIERIVRAEMTELLDAGLFRLPILGRIAKAQRNRPVVDGDPRRRKRRRESAAEKK